MVGIVSSIAFFTSLLLCNCPNTITLAESTTTENGQKAKRDVLR